nr:hypothetical protein HmN_000785100 [Hymenolepis microstoma]
MAESTEPSYQPSAAIVSPVKEVDTKLLQTDAQEFSKESPDLADDFNSILVDIHNFLAKHPTISTKKRSKRKTLLSQELSHLDPNLLTLVKEFPSSSAFPTMYRN